MTQNCDFPQNPTANGVGYTGRSFGRSIQSDNVCSSAQEWRVCQTKESFDTVTNMRPFFTDCLDEVGLEFSDDMKVVCEEFRVVYKQ